MDKYLSSNNQAKQAISNQKLIIPNVGISQFNNNFNTLNPRNDVNTPGANKRKTGMEMEMEMETPQQELELQGPKSFTFGVVKNPMKQPNAIQVPVKVLEKETNKE